MKILHLDNSRMFHAAAEDIIENMHHDYYGALSVQEAYEILDKENIQLIITGLEMRDVNGRHFIEQLAQSKYAKIPVAVLTSTDNMEIRRTLFELGVVDYQLKKNFNAKRLKTYIESLVLSDELILQMRKFKIAVIDDSELTLNVIRNIFELNQIRQVDYYKEARSLLEGPMDYNLYIIDLVLPETSGEELVLKLKEANDDNIIIMISSTSNYKTISHILNLGANDFIIKPFDANTFIIRIKSHIRTYLLMKELEQKNEELLELSVTDGLTKVYNHRHIVQLLKNEVSRSDRYDHKLSIILLDLDNFKKVNDTYGHQVGDEVLRSVARTIKDCIREGDDVGRYGGEEFLVLLPETDHEAAKIVGEKLRAAISNIQYEIEALTTTISGGVASFEGFDYSGMIKKADVNLYLAKKNGKNQII